MVPPDPYTEWVLEFLVKQISEILIKEALPGALSTIRQLWERVKLPRQHRMLVSRVGLINRERELRAMSMALAETHCTRILYLSGLGGVGKTRLLEEAAHLSCEIPTEPPLCWGGILDLYHTELHSVFDLQAAIIQGLDPDRRYFDRYRIAREDFERRKRVDLSGTALDIERKALNELFIEDYKRFARVRRPVLALDTLECLSHESDLIQSLCNLKDISVAVYDWLLKQIGRLDNTLFLLASRPQAALRRDLEQMYGNEPGKLEIIDLSGLTRAECRQLLELFLKEAPPGVQALRSQANRLCKVTAGLPVQLALAVELVAQSEDLVTYIVEGVTDTTTLGQRLVGTLFDYHDPARRTFYYLALARKGLTADLLHYLEPDWPKPDCKQRLVEACELSVVKTRPGREEVFLHDALYELFDAYSPADAPVERWYEPLCDYYRSRQAEAVHDRDAWGQATVNLLYYELQRDPIKAFETGYVRWGEMAIKGREIELDMRLHDELLRFFQNPNSQQRAAAQGLTQAVVERDSAVRWVKRLLIRDHYEQAIATAETILALGPPPYPSVVPDVARRLSEIPVEQQAQAKVIFGLADPLFWGHLLTYYGEALTYTGAPEVRTRRILNDAIALLSGLTLDREEPRTWLRERVLGRAHNRLGYLLRTHGHYGAALTSYRNALPHFETARIEDEQANTLNNLAFLLALLGDLQKAKDYVDQGLNLHQRLGHRYPLAISHNTRGLIYTLQGYVNWGRRECQLALSIFDELEAPRGIGLACNALGFVLRQQGEAWKLGQCSLDQATDYFKQAAGFLERATHIFSERVDEPIRLWEAYNEQGSLSCDWGWLLQHQGDEAAAQQQYDQAVRYHLGALEVAQRHRMRFQEADTCDDLAQVWAAQGNMDEAHHWLEQSLSLVPAEYVLVSGQGFQEAPEPGEAYWLILGKAHFQQGLWALQSIDQDTLPGDLRIDRVRKSIEHFALMAAYFQRYWPGTALLSTRLREVVNLIAGAGISRDDVKALIGELAGHYAVDLTPFLDAVGTEP